MPKSHPFTPILLRLTLYRVLRLEFSSKLYTILIWGDTMKTRIKELRKSRKITQTALAIAIGYSQNMISKIEMETAIPNADFLCKVADYFHTSVDYILYRSDQRYPTFNTNPRINEYLHKLQTLSSKEQESLFLIIDSLNSPRK